MKYTCIFVMILKREGVMKFLINRQQECEFLNLKNKR